MVKVFPVRPDFVPYYWEFVKDYLAASLEHSTGELTLEDIYAYLLKEQMYLWVVKHKTVCGAVVCDVVKYTKKQRINIVAMGGQDFDSWAKEAVEVFSEWVERIGADGIEARVRKGFVDKLQALGFRQVYIGMVKDGPGNEQQNSQSRD